MTKLTMSPNAAENNAQRYFRKAERSETLLKQELKKERAADATKTAKLRELRLAKEAAEKLNAESAEKAGAQAAKATQRPTRHTRQRKRAVVRMV